MRRVVLLWALAVALATTTEEVSRILRWANETRTPIIARGSGTSLSGGSLPVAGGTSEAKANGSARCAKSW